MWGRTLLLLACVLPLTGCTLAGLTVGAIVDDQREARFEERKLGEVDTGDTVILETSRGFTTRGTYEGTLRASPHDLRDYVLTRSEAQDALVRTPRDEVETVEVKQPKRGWLVGGVIGAVIDTAVVVWVFTAGPGSMGELR
jgi:hypothetical protein